MAEPWLTSWLRPIYLEELFRELDEDDVGIEHWLGLHLANVSDAEILRHIRSSGEWRDKHPAPPVPPGQLVGPLRIVDRDSHFADDTGAVLPLGASYGHGLHWFRDHRDECLSDLDAFVKNRYQSVLVWFTHGWYQRAWSGHETTPVDFIARTGVQVHAWPDYDDVVVQFAQALQDRGLRLFLSCGDLQIFQRPRNEWEDPDDFDHPEPDEAACSRWASHIGMLLRPFQNLVVAANVNEPWQNWLGDNQPEPADIDRVVVDPFAEAYKQPFIKLRGASTEEPVDLTAWARDTNEKHGHRGGREEHVAPIRHARIFYKEQSVPELELGVETEPGGPDAPLDIPIMGPINDPESLCLLACSNLANRWGFWFHTAASVRPWLASITDMAGFVEVPGVLDILPTDVMQRFRHITHGGRNDSPFTDADGFPEVDDRRIDSVMTEDRKEFITLVYSKVPYTNLMHRSSVEFRIITPGTWEQHRFTMAAGDVLPVKYRRGRILIGRLID